MHIHTVRQIINNQNEEVAKRFRERVENGKTPVEVCAEDPFLAGEMFALGSLMAKLMSAELDEEHERELRRAQR